MIPITKLFMKFDVQGNTPYPIITNKRPLISGSTSVNFLEVVNFDLLIPPEEHLIFSPTLTIYVYDKIFGGVSERVIGLATLDLTEIVTQFHRSVTLNKASGRLGGKLVKRIQTIQEEDVKLDNEK